MTTTLTRVLLTLSALISLATATETTLDRSESETKSESRNSGLGDGGSVSPSGKVSFKGLPRTLGQWVNLNASALNFNLPNINPPREYARDWCDWDYWDWRTPGILIWWRQ